MKNWLTERLQIFACSCIQFFGQVLPLYIRPEGTVRPDIEWPNNSPEQGPDFYREGMAVTSVITLPTHPLGICICSIAANVAEISVI